MRRRVLLKFSRCFDDLLWLLRGLLLRDEEMKSSSVVSSPTHSPQLLPMLRDHPTHRNHRSLPRSRKCPCQIHSLYTHWTWTFREGCLLWVVVGGVLRAKGVSYCRGERTRRGEARCVGELMMVWNCALVQHPESESNATAIPLFREHYLTKGHGHPWAHFTAVVLVFMRVQIGEFKQ